MLASLTSRQKMRSATACASSTMRKCYETVTKRY